MKNRIIMLLTSAAILSVSTTSAYAVSFITGGVGDNDEMAMQQMQNNYNLKLVFTGERGMYLSDVNVVIRDGAGNEIIQSVTDGPMLLAELKAGTYTIEANAEGFVQKRKVTIKSDHLKTYQLNFPIKDEFVSTSEERHMQQPMNTSIEH